MKLFITILILIPQLVFAIDVNQLMNKVDQLYRGKTSHSMMEMEVKTEHWQRTMKLEAWTKGEDFTFITIMAPKKDKGIATLRRKNEMWNYFPKTNKVMKVSPSMMMGAWMGSDFTNDDLVKENTFLDDYESKLSKETKTDYIIESKAKKDAISLWDRIVTTISKKDSVVSLQECYDEKNVKIRRLEFSEKKKMGDRIVPTVLKLTPLLHKGKYTLIRYINLTFDEPLSDRVFSKGNLRERR